MKRKKIAGKADQTGIDAGSVLLRAAEASRAASSTWPNAAHTKPLRQEAAEKAFLLMRSPAAPVDSAK